MYGGFALTAASRGMPAVAEHAHMYIRTDAVTHRDTIDFFFINPEYHAFDLEGVNLREQV